MESTTGCDYHSRKDEIMALAAVPDWKLASGFSDFLIIDFHHRSDGPILISEWGVREGLD